MNVFYEMVKLLGPITIIPHPEQPDRCIFQTSKFAREGELGWYSVYDPVDDNHKHDHQRLQAAAETLLLEAKRGHHEEQGHGGRPETCPICQEFWDNRLNKHPDEFKALKCLDCGAILRENHLTGYARCPICGGNDFSSNTKSAE